MLLAIYIKLGGLCDDETKAGFSHTALRGRRQGFFERVLSTSTCLHGRIYWKTNGDGKESMEKQRMCWG